MPGLRAAVGNGFERSAKAAEAQLLAVSRAAQLLSHDVGDHGPIIGRAQGRRSIAVRLRSVAVGSARNERPQASESQHDQSSSVARGHAPDQSSSVARGHAPDSSSSVARGPARLLFPERLTCTGRRNHLFNFDTRCPSVTSIGYSGVGPLQPKENELLLNFSIRITGKRDRTMRSWMPSRSPASGARGFA